MQTARTNKRASCCCLLCISATVCDVTWTRCKRERKQAKTSSVAPLSVVSTSKPPMVRAGFSTLTRGHQFPLRQNRNVETISQNQNKHAWQLLHHVTLDFVTLTGSTATSCEETCARGKRGDVGVCVFAVWWAVSAGMSCRSGDEESSWRSRLFESWTLSANSLFFKHQQQHKHTRHCRPTGLLHEDQSGFVCCSYPVKYDSFLSVGGAVFWRLYIVLCEKTMGGNSRSRLKMFQNQSERQARCQFKHLFLKRWISGSTAGLEVSVVFTLANSARLISS